MYIFKAFQDVLFTPKEFFQNKRGEGHLAGTFFYGFLLTVFSGLIRYGYIIVSHATSELEKNKKVTDVATMLRVDVPHLVVLAVIFYAVIMFIGLLFIPLFIHMGVRMMKGTGSLKQTYQVFIFGSTPYFILGAFPIIGYAALVYGLYIKIIGLSEFHALRFDYTIVGYIIGRIMGFIASMIATLIIGFILVILIFAFTYNNPHMQDYFNSLRTPTASSTINLNTHSI